MLLDLERKGLLLCNCSLKLSTNCLTLLGMIEMIIWYYNNRSRVDTKKGLHMMYT